jgi:hypothetical protein
MCACVWFVYFQFVLLPRPYGLEFVVAYVVRLDLILTFMVQYFPLHLCAGQGSDLSIALGVLTATHGAVRQFLVRADTARDRQADGAGPTLLRALRDIWHAYDKDTIRDLEDGCERLLFPVPEGATSTSGKGAPRGGRGSGGKGYRAGRGGGSGGSDGYAQPNHGYAPYPYAQGQYGPPPAPAWGPPPAHMQHQAPQPAAANHEDRCVHCQGLSLSLYTHNVIYAFHECFLTEYLCT